MYNKTLRQLFITFRKKRYNIYRNIFNNSIKTAKNTYYSNKLNTYIVANDKKRRRKLLKRFQTLNLVEISFK